MYIAFDDCLDKHIFIHIFPIATDFFVIVHAELYCTNRNQMSTKR